MPLEQVTTAAGGLMLGMVAHAIGWPFARGGSQSIATALAAYLRSLGGEIQTGVWVRSLADIPPARVVLFDVTPRDLVSIAGDALPAGYRNRLAGYRHGQGVFKIDWALSGPVPWRTVMSVSYTHLDLETAHKAIQCHLACGIDGIVRAGQLCP